MKTTTYGIFYYLPINNQPILRSETAIAFESREAAEEERKRRHRQHRKNLGRGAIPSFVAKASEETIKRHLPR